ncbi:DUF2079 domain-containing protein [Sulfobacillus thermosulfidooxidans]|uniref:DUF2079 domain-containing protein n=1 Tax=Sulfobacillus thermosulfidooxidans TaxID=28034 RepID=UPI0011125E27|nr:DUF2079 domain-containing protein [Sulfobacillus thermosulfidooxidans]
MSYVLLGIAIVLFCSFQVFVSVHKYLNLEATTMDLGYAEQTMWKISHGDWWAFSSVFQTPALAVDGSLWIYPLAYGFRFLGGAYFLFVVQALGTAIAAWGLYRIAYLRGLSKWQSTFVSVTFLLYPAIIGGSQFDFHPDFVALPFIIWAYYFYRANNKILYYVFLVSAILAKNVVLISIGGWGIGLIFWERRIKDGIVAIFLSLLILVVEFKWILPTYFPGANESLVLSLYGYLGHTLFGVITGLFQHFSLVLTHLSHDGVYAFLIFAPVLAIVFFGSASVMATLSLFIFNGISSFAAQQAINDQYQVILSGWVFLALIEALLRFKARRSLFIFGTFLSTMILESIFMVIVIVPEITVNNNYVAQVKKAISHIPMTDVIYTQNHLGLWAYRYPVVGIATDQAPGRLLDTLPTLWKEANPKAKNVPTAIIARSPVRPYLADVIYNAVRNGYRITYYQDHLFILNGSRRFSVPKPSPDVWGWEPTGRSWVVPLWTQGVITGGINWRNYDVEIPQGKPGPIIENLWLILYPGQYKITLNCSAISSTKKERVGVLQIGKARIPITSVSTSMYLNIRHVKIVSVSILTNGHYEFEVRKLVIYYRSFHHN